FVTHDDIIFQSFRRRVTERHDALFASFAEYAKQFVLEIDVAEVELHQLRNAHAGGVKQFEDGPVTLAEFSFSVGCLNKTDSIFNRKMGWQLLFLAWGGNEFRRVKFDNAFAHEELKKRAQGSELAGNRSLSFVMRVQRRG